MANKEDRIMAPLWLKYPNIPQGSIGWRMGYGEDYASEFFQWYYALKKEQQEEYDKKFPKPVCWELSEYNLKRYQDFWIYNWEAAAEYAYSYERIVKEYRTGNKRDIIYFWGHHGKDGGVGKECFSQWYMADFYVGHIKYCCMEQYMMSKKALLFGDEETNEHIMKAENQGEIKALGRKVRGFDENVWNEFKSLIVLTGNYYKFSQLKEARQCLLSSGNAILAEVSPYDTIWGIGMGEKEAGQSEISDWRGENLLGFALMEVREEIARLRKYENEIDDCYDNDEGRN